MTKAHVAKRKRGTHDWDHPYAAIWKTCRRCKLQSERRYYEDATFMFTRNDGTTFLADKAPRCEG